MVEPDRAEIRAWLLGILEQNKETATALAARSGIAQSTLTRFLNNDDAPMLSLRTITKIAHAAGVQPIGIPEAPISAKGSFAENDGIPYSPVPQSPVARAIAALVGDRVATDPWQIRNRALEDVGVLPGDVVIVDLNETPKAGDVVCAQSYRWSEGKAETIFRIYEPPYIVAASRDSATRRPMLVDDDRVVIKGVVIATLRARPE